MTQTNVAQIFSDKKLNQKKGVIFNQSIKQAFICEFVNTRPRKAPVKEEFFGFDGEFTKFVKDAKFQAGIRRIYAMGLRRTKSRVVVKQFCLCVYVCVCCLCSSATIRSIIRAEEHKQSINCSILVSIIKVNILKCYKD